MKKLKCKQNGRSIYFRFQRSVELDFARRRVHRFKVYRISEFDTERYYDAQFREFNDEGLVISENQDNCGFQEFSGVGIPEALFELIAKESRLDVCSSTNDRKSFLVDQEVISQKAINMWQRLVDHNRAEWDERLNRFRFWPKRSMKRLCASISKFFVLREKEGRSD